MRGEQSDEWGDFFTIWGMMAKHTTLVNTLKVAPLDVTRWPRFVVDVVYVIETMRDAVDKEMSRGRHSQNHH